MSVLYVLVNLTSSVEFRGFMIQVRAVGSQQPLGTFSFSIEDFKYKTLTCSQEAVSPMTGSKKCLEYEYYLSLG